MSQSIRDRVELIAKASLMGLGDKSELDTSRKLFASPDNEDPDSYNYDSLDRVELVMALEEEFGVSISDDEADKETYNTIDGIVAWATAL